MKIGVWREGTAELHSILQTALEGDPPLSTVVNTSAPGCVGPAGSTVEGGHGLPTQKPPSRGGGPRPSHTDFLGVFTPCDTNA